MKRVIKWSLIIVPLLIVVVIVIVLLRMNAIAKNVIETQGTASTTLSTTLGSADISIFGGKVGLSDLKIGSPKGFEQTPTMFDMGKLDVRVSYGELRETPMQISEIVVDAPRLVVEQKGGTINVNAAMAQMPPSEPSTLRMQINTLRVNNTQLVVRPGVPMLKPEYQFTLPSIELHNVGMGEGSDNGAAIKDVLQQILVATMQRLRESEQVPEEIRPWLASNVGDLKQLAKDEIARQLQKQLDGGKDEGQKQIQQGLQNLLDRNRK